jgi:hypothetical protein
VQAPRLGATILVPVVQGKNTRSATARTPRAAVAHPFRGEAFPRRRHVATSEAPAAASENPQALRPELQWNEVALALQEK